MPAPQRLFISGHSLLDQPLPDQLHAVAASLGTPLQWRRQHRFGSSIRDRARDVDALAAVNGGRYDTLLITELHDLLATLWWSDSVRQLRRYHDRFVDANPASRTWFFEPWFDIDDKVDPARWLAYERAASPMWQGLVQCINLSLAAEGRTDRIEPLPAGLALAHLVQRVAAAGPLAGVTVERLFDDEVHLSPLGMYYMALVVYAYLFARSPEGAWAPSQVDAATALALQGVAWEAVRTERAQRTERSLEWCRTTMQGRFNLHYWRYTRHSARHRPAHPIRAWLTPFVGALRTWLRLRRSSPRNPLRMP